MSLCLQTHPGCILRFLFARCWTAVALAGVLTVGGCGDIECPEPLHDVGGNCQDLSRAGPGPEPCDGLDNDGDDEVDEDWPELGAACGEGGGRGECVEGVYVCSNDGAGVVCEGAVGPAKEVCDGKDNDCDGIRDNGPAEICDGEDNDCDGLVDEGVLSAKSAVFDQHTTVTSVDGAFVVTRVTSDVMWVETYDTTGSATGHDDFIASPTDRISFVVSEAWRQRVIAAVGYATYHVLHVQIDSDMTPVIMSMEQLHDDWYEALQSGVYAPPYHPRVSASPRRFIGHVDANTFGLNVFGDDSSELRQSPTITDPMPQVAEFDSYGHYLLWEDSDRLRAAWLTDQGEHAFEAEVAQGHTPAMAKGPDGPAAAYLQDGELHMSELGAATLRCELGGFCNTPIEGKHEEQVGPVGLAFDEVRDRWFIAAGTELLVVAKHGEGAVTQQVLVRDVLPESPNRVDVATVGGTAAIVQSTADGQSALIFLGCF